MATSSPTYSVCITTARRNDFLRDLLASLEQQVWLPEHDAFEIIVVDNNPEGSAKVVVDGFAARPWNIRYLHCSVPSIPVARNTAVEAARHEEVVLIDDDQLLPPELFKQLNEAWSHRRLPTAAGIFRRRLQFEPGVSIWATHGGVDRPLDYPHAAPIPPSHGHTGGVVIHRAVFDRVKFDPKWALRGCDDNAFFKSVGELGMQIIYLRHVEIIERIQASRSTFSALLVQGYQQGLCFAHVELEGATSVDLVVFLMKAAAALALYGLALPFFIMLRGRAAIRTLKRLARQFGKFAGAFGFSYDYYSH